MKRFAPWMALGIAFCVGLVQASAASNEDPSYALPPWPYGAIAWVGDLPDDVQTFSTVLTQAVEDVFVLWELSLPSIMPGWEDPSLVEPAWKTGQATGPIPQVLKRDPRSNKLWRLNPLDWEGIATYPLVFVAFPSRLLLAQALGDMYVGGRYARGSAATPGSAVWYQRIIDVPQVITAPASDGWITIWHEFAHWMTYLVCRRDSVNEYDLPDLILEGIADYTMATLAGISNWKTYAKDWEEDNDLAVELDPYSTYHIGATVVAYFVETQGAPGFLRSLPAWVENPALRIEEMAPGWRAWLASR